MVGGYSLGLGSRIYPTPQVGRREVTRGSIDVLITQRLRYERDRKWVGGPGRLSSSRGYQRGEPQDERGVISGLSLSHALSLRLTG